MSERRPVSKTNNTEKDNTITNLFDIVDQEELDWLISERRIAKQVHPDLPIHILNYTAAAQYKNVWLNSERICRGLIVEDGTNRIVARGPQKFMNYGDPKAPSIPLDALTRVTKKHDGSLGIGWMYDGHFGIATRGSFMSDQAKHATANMTDQDRFDIQQAALFRSGFGGSTQVWEIVYPDNRIVLDYGDFDGLLPLGLVDNEDGKIHFRPEEIYQTDVITFAEAVALPVPPDEEGYVLDVQPFGETHHVKLKGEEYKILHGLLTNTNARRIWVQLAARACHHWIERDQDWASMLKNDPEDFKRVDVTKDITETLLTNVPDEFYDWVTKQIDSINDKVSDLVIQSILLAGQISMTNDKKARFEAVKGHVMCMDILRFVEHRDESRLIIKAWQLAKPEGDETPFKTQTEED